MLNRYPLFKGTPNILFIYLAYISLIIISSILFAYLFSHKLDVMDNNNNILLGNIPFDFGELIVNLTESKGYYHTIDDVKYFLKKLPALPLLIVFIGKISLNYYFVIIFKNIIIFSTYFFAVYFLLRGSFNNNFLILILIAPICLPYNYNVALNYVYGDCLTAIFLPLLFVSLLSFQKYRLYFTSIILFILYFSKPSMFLIVSIIPFFILFFEKKNKLILRIMPFIFMILAVSSWGIFSYQKTGKFAYGSTSLSQNAFGLSFSFNREFKNYYPNKSTDLIPQHYPKFKFNSEWDWYNYYDKRNKEYLKNNLDRYLKDCLIKIKFIFFGVNRDGAFPDKNGIYNNNFRVSVLISKIILNFAIIFSLIKLCSNIKNIYLIKEEFYFLSILSLNIAPHIVGWATSKHLVGILNISIIYLVYCFYNYFKKI